MVRLIGTSPRTSKAEIDNVVEHEAGLRSVGDASRILHMEPADVAALLDRGAFPDAYRIDGQWRIPLHDIRRILLSGTGEALAGLASPAVLVRRRRPYGGETHRPPAWLTPAERRGLIVERLKRRGVVRVSTLSAELGVSQMTIRRDLTSLAVDGRLVRTYGGAMALGSHALLLASRQDPLGGGSSRGSDSEYRLGHDLARHHSMSATPDCE